MTEYAPTDEIGLLLPVPNTGQAWRTDEYIVGNFNKVDDAFTADRARLVKLEGLLRGNTAARDAFWGTASTPAARVTLANKYPTWYNTDKGWEEQFFAQFDDGGSASTPAKRVGGWGPHQSLGLVPITRFTASVTSGTVAKKGAWAEVLTAAARLDLDGVFTADFETYVVRAVIETSANSADIIAQFRAAGVLVNAANYDWFRIDSAGSTGSAANTVGANNADRMVFGSNLGHTNGGHLEFTVQRPQVATELTLLSGMGASVQNAVRQFMAVYKVAQAHDGIGIGSQAGPSLNPGTRVAVFGVNSF